MTTASQTTIERYFAGISARDPDRIVADLADDVVWSWPGSGEVIRGRERVEAVVRATPRLPAVVVHRLVGDGDVVVAVWTGDYGDGIPWRNMSLFELRGGKITGKVDCFGSAFEPPAWRRDLVEVEPLPKP